MKTLILLILITISNAPSSKLCITEAPAKAAACTMKTVHPADGHEPSNAANDNKNLEMPNNWNIKVIEW
jgi:hypothetical protein